MKKTIAIAALTALVAFAAVALGGGTVITQPVVVPDNSVTMAKLADVATARIVGRVTAGTGDPEALTGTQATTLLDTFTSSLKGLVPASGGGTSNFLRADGSWAVAGTGDITGVTVMSPACSAGTFMATLTGGATSGDAPIGGTCVAEVGDVSSVTVTDPGCAAGTFVANLTGGAASGAVPVGGTCVAEVGDISGVTAGTGLSGGGASGAVSLAVNIAGASCSAGQVVTAIGATGTGTCTAIGTAGGVTGTGTSGKLAAWNGTTSETDYAGASSCSAGSFFTGFSSAGASTCTSAISGTSGRSTYYSGTNALSTGGWTDDGTNETANGTLTSIVGANTFGEERGNVTSPTALSANQNDYGGCNSNTRICQLSATSSTRQITGMTGGAAGRTETLINTGASIDIQLTNEDANSTAANRFTLLGAQTWTMKPGCSITVIYDGTASRWKMSAFACNTLPAITLAGTVTLSANLSQTTGYFQLGASVSPASISGTNNNYAVSATTVNLYQGLSADATITGISSSSNDGRILRIFNVSAANVITLTNNDSGSLAANRFQFPDSQNVTIPPGGTVVLQYYTGTNDWHLWGSGSASPTLRDVVATGNLTSGDGDADVTNVRGIAKDSGTAATLSSCGTSPSITGGSWSFRITAGTGGITACTATFASTKTNTPSCIAKEEDAAEDVYISAISATAITITAKTGTTDLSSNVIDVICVGDG